MSGQLFSDEEWGNLYLILKPRVAHWVRTSNIPLWTRQRDAIIEDIMQDAILKMVAYAQRAERGEARMIDSLESVSVVTAYHCYVDARRRDLRVVPFMQDSQEPVEYAATSLEMDLSEQAINNIHYELLFMHVARWIVNFPDKQRTALLIDLANRMYFDPFYSTPLQQAFSSVGIFMQDYQRLLPDNLVERARHAAHLSLAYKRIALIAYMQQYTLVTAI